jgi:hypothetical protein
MQRAKQAKAMPSRFNGVGQIDIYKSTIVVIIMPKKQI